MGSSLNDTVRSVSHRLALVAGLREEASRQLADVSSERERAEREAQLYAEALSVLLDLEHVWRERFEEVLEDTVTDGLQSVFGEDLRLSVDTSTERKASVTDLTLKTGHGPVDPAMDGGSLVQVMSLLLRVLFIRLSYPPLRPLLVLDETLNAVSEEYQPAVASLLKALSESMGVQVLFVTHNKIFTDYADAVYSVNRGTVRRL